MIDMVLSIMLMPRHEWRGRTEAGMKKKLQRKFTMNYPAASGRGIKTQKHKQDAPRVAGN